MRQTIARRMTQSKQEMPHFYVTASIDMTKAMALREELNELWAGEARLTVNDLIIKASALALAKFPAFNSHYADGVIKPGPAINIGVAIALEDGLIAPAILDCGSKTLKEISVASRDLSTRARNGVLKPEEYTEATVAISNLGMFQVDSFIAIINPRQSASIAVGSVTKPARGEGRTDNGSRYHAVHHLRRPPGGKRRRGRPVRQRDQGLPGKTLQSPSLSSTPVPCPVDGDPCGRSSSRRPYNVRNTATGNPRKGSLPMKIKSIHAAPITNDRVLRGPETPKADWYGEIFDRGTVWSPPRFPTWGHVACVVTAEDGTWGLGMTSNAGPVASIINDHYAGFLTGENCMATEKLWTLMVDSSVHYSAAGLAGYAISAVDLALWDLKAKLLGKPVYELLGGPTKDALFCYATGFDIEWIKELGFGAVKLGLSATDTHAPTIIGETEEMVAAARESLGPDRELMIDCYAISSRPGLHRPPGREAEALPPEVGWRTTCCRKTWRGTVRCGGDCRGRRWPRGRGGTCWRPSPQRPPGTWWTSCSPTSATWEA